MSFLLPLPLATSITPSVAVSLLATTAAVSALVTVQRRNKTIENLKKEQALSLISDKKESAFVYFLPNKTIASNFKKEFESAYKTRNETSLYTFYDTVDHYFCYNDISLKKTLQSSLQVNKNSFMFVGGGKFSLEGMRGLIETLQIPKTFVNSIEIFEPDVAVSFARAINQFRLSSKLNTSTIVSRFAKSVQILKGLQSQNKLDKKITITFDELSGEKGFSSFKNNILQQIQDKETTSDNEIDYSISSSLPFGETAPSNFLREIKSDLSGSTMFVAVSKYMLEGKSVELYYSRGSLALKISEQDPNGSVSNVRTAYPRIRKVSDDGSGSITFKQIQNVTEKPSLFESLNILLKSYVGDFELLKEVLADGTIRNLETLDESWVKCYDNKNDTKLSTDDVVQSAQGLIYDILTTLDDNEVVNSAQTMSSLDESEIYFSLDFYGKKFFFQIVESRYIDVLFLVNDNFTSDLESSSYVIKRIKSYPSVINSQMVEKMKELFANSAMIENYTDVTITSENKSVVDGTNTVILKDSIDLHNKMSKRLEDVQRFYPFQNRIAPLSKDQKLSQTLQYPVIVNGKLEWKSLQYDVNITGLFGPDGRTSLIRALQYYNHTNGGKFNIFYDFIVDVFWLRLGSNDDKFFERNGSTSNWFLLYLEKEYTINNNLYKTLRPINFQEMYNIFHYAASSPWEYIIIKCPNDDKSPDFFMIRNAADNITVKYKVDPQSRCSPFVSSKKNITKYVEYSDAKFFRMFDVEQHQLLGNLVSFFDPNDFLVKNNYHQINASNGSYTYSFLKWKGYCYGNKNYTLDNHCYFFKENGSLMDVTGYTQPLRAEKSFENKVFNPGKFKVNNKNIVYLEASNLPTLQLFLDFNEFVVQNVLVETVLSNYTVNNNNNNNKFTVAFESFLNMNGKTFRQRFDDFGRGFDIPKKNAITNAYKEFDPNNPRKDSDWELRRNTEPLFDFN